MEYESKDFYIYSLSKSSKHDVVRKILERGMKAGKRSVIFFGDEQQMKDFDMFLWTYRDDAFIPHGTDQDIFPEKQPVLLTTKHDFVNDPDIAIFTEDSLAAPDNNLDNIKRICIVLSGVSDILLRFIGDVVYSKVDYFLDIRNNLENSSDFPEISHLNGLNVGSNYSSEAAVNDDSGGVVGGLLATKNQMLGGSVPRNRDLFCWAEDKASGKWNELKGNDLFSFLFGD